MINVVCILLFKKDVVCRLLVCVLANEVVVSSVRRRACDFQLV
jgi:hypothetical protein